MKVKKLKEILNKLSDSDPIMEKEIIVHKLGSLNKGECFTCENYTNS